MKVKKIVLALTLGSFASGAMAFNFGAIMQKAQEQMEQATQGGQNQSQGSLFGGVNNNSKQESTYLSNAEAIENYCEGRERNTRDMIFKDEFTSASRELAGKYFADLDSLGRILHTDKSKVYPGTALVRLEKKYITRIDSPLIKKVGLDFYANPTPKTLAAVIKAAGTASDYRDFEDTDNPPSDRDMANTLLAMILLQYRDSLSDKSAPEKILRKTAMYDNNARAMMARVEIFHRNNMKAFNGYLGSGGSSSPIGTETIVWAMDNLKGWDQAERYRQGFKSSQEFVNELSKNKKAGSLDAIRKDIDVTLSKAGNINEEMLALLSGGDAVSERKARQDIIESEMSGKASVIEIRIAKNSEVEKALAEARAKNALVDNKSQEAFKKAVSKKRDVIFELKSLSSQLGVRALSFDSDINELNDLTTQLENGFTDICSSAYADTRFLQEQKIRDDEKVEAKDPEDPSEWD